MNGLREEKKFFFFFQFVIGTEAKGKQRLLFPCKIHFFSLKKSGGGGG